MPAQFDRFEVTTSCRKLYLGRLRELLSQNSQLSGHAIEAILQGCAAYFDEIQQSRRRGSFEEEADGLTSSRITLVGDDDLELGIRLDNLSARLFESTAGSLWKTHLRFVTLFVICPTVILLTSRLALDGTTARACAWLGELSYPLYITHFPIRRLLHEIDAVAALPDSARFSITAAVALTAAVLFADADRRLRQRLARRRPR